MSITIVPAIALFLSIGIWQEGIGHSEAARFNFVAASAGVIAAVLLLGSRRLASRHTITRTLSLDVDAPTALRWASEALRLLTPDAELRLDDARLSVSTELDQQWQRWERVTAVIRPATQGLIVEVSSHSMLLTFRDRARNEANVDAVIRSLAAFQRPEA